MRLLKCFLLVFQSLLLSLLVLFPQPLQHENPSLRDNDLDDLVAVVKEPASQLDLVHSGYPFSMHPGH